jgi:hypothetical protein
MIIVKLQGGLGNQMFQYACGRAVALKWGAPLYLDISSFPDRNNRDYQIGSFGINAKIFKEKRFFNLSRRNKKADGLFEETVPYTYSPEVFELGRNIYLKGYFQNPKYFSAITATLRSEFELNDPMLPRHYLAKIAGTESVAVHVRRSDYLTNPVVREELGFCGERYFYKAQDFMRMHISNPVFFFFSDDIDWCEKTFNVGNAHFVKDVGNAELELILMKRCKHHIISNSSFGWWGAFLGDHKNSINIFPTPWWIKKKWDAKELCPECWMGIQR